MNATKAVRKKILPTKILCLCLTDVTAALETKVSAAAAELFGSGMQGSSHKHAERVWAARHTELPTAQRAAAALPGELSHLRGEAGTAHARGAAAAGGSFT